MGTFVSGNTALPTPKQDANPPQGLLTELDAADINSLWNALGDVRAALGFPSRTTVADAAYTALGTDGLVAFTSLTASRIVTLPTATSNRQVLYIKDESGSAAAGATISVKAAAGQSVDGIANPSTLVVIDTAYAAACLYSNGTSWFQLF